MCSTTALQKEENLLSTPSDILCLCHHLHSLTHILFLSLIMQMYGTYLTYAYLPPFSRFKTCNYSIFTKEQADVTSRRTLQVSEDKHVVVASREQVVSTRREADRADVRVVRLEALQRSAATHVVQHTCRVLVTRHKQPTARLYTQRCYW